MANPYDEEDELPEGLLDALRVAPIMPEEWIDRLPFKRAQVELRPRERDVLRCLSHGMSREQTADALHISVETVKTNLKGARYGLRAKTTIHAVSIALRRGLID